MLFTEVQKPSYIHIPCRVASPRGRVQQKFRKCIVSFFSEQTLELVSSLMQIVLFVFLFSSAFFLSVCLSVFLSFASDSASSDTIVSTYLHVFQMEIPVSFMKVAVHRSRACELRECDLARFPYCVAHRWVRTAVDVLLSDCQYCKGTALFGRRGVWNTGDS